VDEGVEAYLHSFLAMALGEVEWFALKLRPLYHCGRSPGIHRISGWLDQHARFVTACKENLWTRHQSKSVSRLLSPSISVCILT